MGLIRHGLATNCLAALFAFTYLVMAVGWVYSFHLINGRKLGSSGAAGGVQSLQPPGQKILPKLQGSVLRHLLARRWHLGPAELRVMVWEPPGRAGSFAMRKMTSNGSGEEDDI